MSGVEGGLVLVAACDFGWGSIGKLRLVLDELTGVPVALHARHAGAAAVEELLGSRHRFVHGGEEPPAVALVINDPRAADDIAGLGVPVIYVDSLPYLWTTPAEVPRQVALYCAQRSPARALPPDSPLDGRAGIRWIDPIVPPSSRRRGGGGVVVNVGGLHSHLSGTAVDVYLRAVVLPLARILGSSGRPVAAVCGNLPHWAVRELTGLLPPGTRVGAQTPYEFEATLRRADLLVTSPGSTTMLQAAATGVATVLLPPQNLSQLLNAELYARPGPAVVAWPDSVIDRARVEALRPAGEDTVLEYVYGAIAGVTAPALTAVAAAMSGALEAGESALSPALADLGSRGAGQVARLVRQALLAPLPRPRPAGGVGTAP